MNYELPGVRASQSSSNSKHSPKVITAIGILLVCNLLLYGKIFFHHSEGIPSIKAFPSRISGWESRDVSYDPKVLSSLDPDKIIYKTYYRNQEDAPVTLFMAFYNTFEKADLSHSPIVCFTGQGWEIKENGEVMVPLGSSNASHIMVNKIDLQRIGTKMIALYWYQGAHSAFANRGIQKLYLLWDKLRGRSDRNAFVRVTVTIPDGESEQKMIAYLSSFVKALYPALRGLFS